LEALVILSSRHTVKETVDRLIILLERHGMAIYARINRQAESKWHELETRPMECILFDKPQLSGPVIQKYPVLALCFPMRIIVWEENGCQVAYKDPAVMLQMYDPALEGFHWPDLRTDILQVLQN
jgi:uncharacterized protein (DUF302 family)